MPGKDQKEAVRYAENFNFGKLSVVEGERTTDEDIFQILSTQVGEEPLAWLALSRNAAIKTQPKLLHLVADKFMRLCNARRSLFSENPLSADPLNKATEMLHDPVKVGEILERADDDLTPEQKEIGRHLRDFSVQHRDEIERFMEAIRQRNKLQSSP